MHIHDVLKFMLSYGWRVQFVVDIWDASVELYTPDGKKYMTREVEYTAKDFSVQVLQSLACLFSLIVYMEDKFNASH